MSWIAERDETMTEAKDNLQPACELAVRLGVLDPKTVEVVSTDRSDSRTDHFDYCWSIDS